MVSSFASGNLINVKVPDFRFGLINYNIHQPDFDLLRQ